jgi:hypothetical protein
MDAEYQVERETVRDLPLLEKTRHRRLYGCAIIPKPLQITERSGLRHQRPKKEK